jgi:hypothetical protein
MIDPDFECWSVWEDRARKSAAHLASRLQAVYADGSPRNYDDD